MLSQFEGNMSEESHTKPSWSLLRVPSLPLSLSRSPIVHVTVFMVDLFMAQLTQALACMNACARRTPARTRPGNGAKYTSPRGWRRRGRVTCAASASSRWRARFVGQPRNAAIMASASSAFPATSHWHARHAANLFQKSMKSTTMASIFRPSSIKRAAVVELQAMTSYGSLCDTPCPKMSKVLFRMTLAL